MINLKNSSMRKSLVPIGAWFSSQWFASQAFHLIVCHYRHLASPFLILLKQSGCRPL
jgi:hypothetical protein